MIKVKAYSYKRNGKTVHVKAHTRNKDAKYSAYVEKFHKEHPNGYEEFYSEEDGEVIPVPMYSRGQYYRALRHKKNPKRKI